MSLKKTVKPPGIDPGTVRLVAQRLNDYTTPGPETKLFYFVTVLLYYNRTDRYIV